MDRKCSKCGSTRHNTEDRRCCNCQFFIAPNQYCKQGHYASREGECSKHKREYREIDFYKDFEEELFRIRIISPYDFTDIAKMIEAAIGEWMSSRALRGFVNVELITDRWASRYKGGGNMGMNPDSGDLRPLTEDDPLREGEVCFVVGEPIEIKGCNFVVESIYPNPENRLVLKGQPKEKAALEKEEEKLEESSV